MLKVLKITCLAAEQVLDVLFVSLGGLLHLLRLLLLVFRNELESDCFWGLDSRGNNLLAVLRQHSNDTLGEELLL